MLALRTDFLDRAADDRRPFAELARGLVLLSPVGREGLREALTRPVEGLGYRFESEALVEQMLDALAGARTPLPLLQFAASKLWAARDVERRLLTEASYERLGGVGGALAAHADEALAGLSDREQRLCGEIMRRLVTPERTRAVVSLGELRLAVGSGGAGRRPGDVDQVVRRSGGGRNEASTTPGSASARGATWRPWWAWPTGRGACAGGPSRGPSPR